MRHLLWLWALFTTVIVAAPTSSALAQGNTAATPGDPPIASLISISAPDENGIVTITGAPGAVFPAAQVAVRNLYTGEVVYVAAGITGAFTANIYGPGNTPFHVSPAASIPSGRRSQPGSLPGGPGTILYGAFPENPVETDVPVTQIVLDGVLTDWEAYPQAALRGGFALQNLDAIYLGLDEPPEDFARVQVQVQSNATTFDILVNPHRSETATWTEQSDAFRELGTIAATAAVDNALEVKIPLAPVLDRLAVEDAELQLTQVAYLDANDNIVADVSGAVTIPQVGEQSGIVYLESNIEDDPIRFSVSGALAGGGSRWHARARTNTLTYQPGDTFHMEMDVRLRLPELPETLTGLAAIGRFGLLPVADANGLPVSGALNSNNGWASVMTQSGLAIENLPSDFVLGEVTVPPPQIIRQGDDLAFGFSVSLAIPQSLPAGTYVPYFEGFGQIGDGDRFRWTDEGLFGVGDAISRVPSTRLPIVLSIGTTQPEPKRLLWVLFMDEPSNGSRGILPDIDQNNASLSNRVKFNSPTYILPPSTRYNEEVVTYSIEPALVNMLPNSYYTSAAPLLPLLFPNGRMNATITKPDGRSEGLSSAPIVQNTLSTPALDEQTRFGEHTQVDTYHLTTLNDLYTNQTFEDYGEYTIELSGFVEDVWGNRYEGGGNYTFLVAETMTIAPAVLPGTPFEVGDVFNAGVSVSPGVAAQVTVYLRVYPLDGSDVIERTIEGTANAYGRFQPEETFVFEAPGEYMVDYEVRYTDSQDRLWAGSLRGAGVIGTPANEIVLRGQRGLANDEQEINPAWFFAEQLSLRDSETARFYPPFHSGDVLWLQDSRQTGIFTRFSLQDLTARYAEWLAQTHPDYTSSEGRPLERLAAQDDLPSSMFAADAQTDNLIPFDSSLVVNRGYTYLSFVRPEVAVRQFVLGGEQGEVPLSWNPTDPLNGQVGAGFNGTLPGDFVFLFGGAVLDNESANLRQSAIYGALATVISEDDPLGARVTPPYRGAAGGPNGGALLAIVDEEQVDMFFHPTAIRPGEVLEVGDVMSVAGLVAPTLASNIEVTVTSPSGQVRTFAGLANSVGYYYDPIQDFAVDEIGVWTVQIEVNHRGRTSSGVVQPPYPSGGTLGADVFSVYVVPEGERLPWTQSAETDFTFAPGFPSNITFNPPAGWTDVKRYLTVRFPSRIVQDGVAEQPGGALLYQYNPTALSQQFPFFEGDDGRESGSNSADPLYLTFVFTGMNADGEFDILAREVALRYDRLLTLE